MASTSWFNGTDTSSSNYYNTIYSNVSIDFNSAPKQKHNYRYKPIEQIIAANILKGSVIIFANHTSLAFKNNYALANAGIKACCVDPVLPGHNNQPALLAYDYAVIIDVLEYLPVMMARANVIKEALLTLKRNSHDIYDSNACIIMMTETPNMVDKLAKKEKYESIEDRFLIKSKSELNGLTIKGIDAEELIETAYFAGARMAEVYKDVKTDMICIRAYPKQIVDKKSVGG